MSAVADGVDVPSENIFWRLAKFLWLETESVDKVRKAIDAQLAADAGKLLSEGQLERIAIHEDETLAKGIGVCGAVVAIRLCEWGGVWADGTRRYYRALPAFTAFFGAYHLVRAVQGSSMLYGVMTEPDNIYVDVHGTSNRSYVGLYLDYTPKASEPEGRIVYNCGAESGGREGLVEYRDGLIQFVQPNDCHFNATSMIRSILDEDDDAPGDLQLVTRKVGGREVVAFIPTFGRYGDADLQMFAKRSGAGVSPWTRDSIWYSSPQHSTIHGIYCSNTAESNIIIDLPFEYYRSYDPMAITGPAVHPVELNMSARGGLVVELNSEVMSSLEAVKRVELPSRLNGSSIDADSGTYDDYSVPRTIVDFSDLPQVGDVSGEYGRFDSFRCTYESAWSSLIDCSYSFTTDPQAFSRMTQFSRTTCEDMVGNNVWSHGDQSLDPSMGYPKILKADPAYYYDFCVKEFDEGKLQWQLTMRPLECRNSDFNGQSSNSYVVLRGVPHVAWYLYGTYDTLEDCQTDTNFDGNLYFQVQSDCNSRSGSWACMTRGKCKVEVKANGSSGYYWIAYLVITLVALTVAIFLGTRAYLVRRGSTAAGAAAKAEPMGVDDKLAHAIPTGESHFGMPMDKVVKVLAAAKAQMHPEASNSSTSAHTSDDGTVDVENSRNDSDSVGDDYQRYIPRWRFSKSDSGQSTRMHFTDPAHLPRGALDTSNRVVVKRSPKI
ncbi:hypothetical protein FOZ61_004821 [Perkinsus olseni]|uniref:Uncharacterized protein n=1 Tax=Perkinsus olseni TaxID=32597 RepID=A0A7J6LXK0_PEROL|nr:hypothetical protein FOZ61_004821 [Perkinsus olseni]KAF4663997.1 hypothetical protein FOL46_004467 [Perkinsus olseni]